MFRVVIFCVCILPQPVAFAGPADFLPPVDVEIEGYSGHAMEPFLSRDGVWLLFNTRNGRDDQTDLHAAKRINAAAFKYFGPIDGANSKSLDGVASLDRHGNLYFVSNRDYGESLNTLWTASFADGNATNAAALRGNAPRRKLLWLNIDAEISANGDRLYFAENKWGLFGGGLKSSDILVAARDATGAFNRLPDADDLFERINTKQLEFAPALSDDELTLYFTRLDMRAARNRKPGAFGIFVATRPSISAVFGEPSRIEAISGHVEAPTVSPDGCSIYFHELQNDVFRIRMTSQKACGD